MKSKIGKFEVINTQTLLIHDNNDAWIEFVVMDWTLKLRITFEDSSSAANESKFIIRDSGDHGVITFINWNSTLGNSLKEPIDIARTQGRNIYLMAISHKIGNILKLDIQFYMESQDGE
jgi:hypothetical protein